MAAPGVSGILNPFSKQATARRTRPSTGPLTRSYQLAESATKVQLKDYGDIMGGYRDYLGLAKTGGYSPEDIQNIRARAISPIRSAYAGASRDVERQRGLQGGYSPNIGAVRSRLAREQSEQLSRGMTDVNAQLAQNIAQNKLSAIPGALSGMQSLYGTTPGLSQLFGQQALSAAQLQNRINQGGQQAGLNLISQSLRR